MDSAPLLLPFILCSLVATTYSLTCSECIGQSDKPCQGRPVTCAADFDACVATVETDSKDGKEITWYRKCCGKKSMCSYTGSFTADILGKKASSTCCFTSNCDPLVPKLPTQKTEDNGLSCKSCSTEQGSACETIECTGEEKKCLTLTTLTQAAQVSMFVSGCGTPEWCEKDREFQFAGQTTKISFACSGGVGPLAPGAPLLLLAALLIVGAMS